VKAVVKTGRGEGRVELREVSEPEVRPGWVLLEVSGVGICGTDVHILHDEHPYWPPVTLGHEFSGRIAAVGSGVEGWVEGDRVVCEPHAGACGVCHLCRRGYHQLCAEKRSPGWGIDGAMARYVAVPAHLLHRIPDEVSDRAASVCEPTAISVSAIERVGIEPGDTVAVFGPGPIGLLTAMVARALGTDRVVVIGRSSSEQRLRVASELGLEVWNSSESDVVAVAQETTSGRGFDVAIDTSGAAAAIAAGVQMLRRRGRLCAVGVSGQETIEFPWDAALFRALDVAFSFSSSYTSGDRSLSLMRSGVLDVEPLTTVFPLENWREAFGAVEGREVVKALLSPNIDHPRYAGEETADESPGKE
jgi:L-iditol 2-dehydrogenase